MRFWGRGHLRSADLHAKLFLQTHPLCSTAAAARHRWDCLSFSQLHSRLPGLWNVCDASFGWTCRWEDRRGCMAWGCSHCCSWFRKRGVVLTLGKQKGSSALTGGGKYIEVYQSPHRCVPPSLLFVMIRTPSIPFAFILNSDVANRLCLSCLEKKRNTLLVPPPPPTSSGRPIDNPHCMTVVVQ